MKKTVYRNLSLVLFLVLIFASCSKSSTAIPKLSPTFNPYPSPDSNYPAPSNGLGDVEASLPADAPLPTSGSGGRVTGILKAGNPLEPVYQLPFYLGEVIMLKDGRPGVVSLDKAAAPRALIDKNGRFVFLNVPDGKYSLVLDFVIHTLILRQPSSGEDIYIDVKAGDTVDLGELDYSDLEVKPPDK
jgi:hypothetical protein